MKSLLRLNVSRQLSLTPQLQQAIRLLRLSTLDLQQEIQNQVDTNPFLELTPNEEADQKVQDQADLPEEEYDFQWSNLYPNASATSSEDKQDYEEVQSSVFSLQDYLRWQFHLISSTDVDKIIASTIIDAINEDGFLTLSLVDLQKSLSSKKNPIEIAEIEVVRHQIQHFDPIGCGSLNLKEVLLVQLDQLPTNTPYLSLVKKIIHEQIKFLSKHHHHQLMKLYQIDEDTLNEILTIIRHLNPKPGNATMSSVNLQQVRPDVIVKKIGQAWKVELNPALLPRLSINHYYASLIKQTKNSRDMLFLKNNLQNARWFLKSIESRQQTLLKVARYIVDYQKDFLVFGEEAMKPLVLHDVAEALNMHESTISRVTTQKFIYTPRGLFELKYFFSSQLSTDIGGKCSSTAICGVIKKLIHHENHCMPLSDNEITKLINEQGIHVARRTVAKYRERMGIAPSYERKSISS